MLFNNGKAFSEVKKNSYSITYEPY